MLRQLSLENGLLETAIIGALVKGFTEKAEGFSILLPYLGEIEELKKDLLPLDYTLFDNHIEIYSDKENLEKFREKYSIEFMILFHSKKQTDHLAFDGRVFKAIEYIIKNPQN